MVYARYVYMYLHDPYIYIYDTYLYLCVCIYIDRSVLYIDTYRPMSYITYGIYNTDL